MSIDTDTAAPETVAYPFTWGEGIGLPEVYTELLAQRAPVRVQLPYGEPAWLVTRYDDARLVLADPRFSRAMAVHRDEPRMTPRPVPESILTLDAPEHTRVRALVAKAFTGRRVEAMRPWIAELATGLVAGLRARGDSAELVEELALPFPVTVICEMLGVDEADRDKVRRGCDAALSTNEMTDDECAESFGELFAYFQRLVAQRRAEPRDDLVSALIEARDAHDRLSEPELVSLCIALLIGGFETTASQIPNFVYLLQQRPDLWRRLCEDPALIPSAVEEMMRFVPFAPNGISPRYALEDIEIGGVPVRAGEPVIVDTSAANRDGLAFPDADDVVLDRAPNRHLVFGHGAHRCPGAQLARAEVQEALRALLEQMPDLRICGEIEWKLDSHVHSPRVLPISW